MKVLAQVGARLTAGLILASCDGGDARSSAGGVDAAVPGEDAGQVADMVHIPGSAGHPSFAMDATEVTRAAYTAWLATEPVPAMIASCEGNSDLAPAAECMAKAAVCQGADCDDHPQVCVDWCDASAYCLSAGKRLCGRIGGGAIDFSSEYDDPETSEWFRACTVGGTQGLPYGDEVDSAACNGSELGLNTTIEVGTMASCASMVEGFAGVYDLSGNVLEWEASSPATTDFPEVPDPVRIRGGSFAVGADLLRCDAGFFQNRDATQSDIGFRCCAD